MAYDLESEDCQRGDYFIRNFSLITSNWPIMLTGGNHDAGNNTKFSLFNGLFYKAKDLVYSWELGSARFISFNPFKFFFSKNSDGVEDFFDLLETELARESDDISWKIVYSHYPILCTVIESNVCKYNAVFFGRIVDLLIKYSVHLYINSHEHYYERQSIHKLNPNHKYDKI